MHFSGIKQYFLDILFPKFCLNCQREGQVLCEDCFGLLEINPWQFCPFCSQPQRLINRGKCPKHQNQKLDGLFSAVSFGNPIIKKLIHAFKYPPYLKIIAPTLSQVIIAHFSLSENQRVFHSQPKIGIVPLPLFSKRQKERGYNQAELLARELAKAYSMPILQQALLRVKNTPQQVGLDRKQRQKNIQDAFWVQKPELIAGQKIFLIDDVFTTGSTLEEAAKTLKRAGALEVWGIVVARE